MSTDKDDTCTLSDSDLIDKCHQWISDLAESGGKKWTLRVPVDMNNDPDMLFAELCDRFTGRRPRRPEHRPENPDGFARRENIFDAIARERMESYELRGFKRVFAALYGVIQDAMYEYANLEVARLRAEEGRGPETQNADALTVLKELVALKGFKDNYNTLTPIEKGAARGFKEYYDKRESFAWETARKLTKL